MSVQDPNDLAPDPASGGPAIALGAERLGLIGLSWPGIMLAIALALAVVAGLGVQRTRVDDSLSPLFRSDTPDFKHTRQ